MDKKEIYEHLAKIYLDASAKKKKKTKEPARFKYLFFLLLIVTSGLVVIFSGYSLGNKNANTQIALFLQNDVSKINFNFNPAKKETYSIDLNKLNLNKFNTLAFALKRSDYKDSVSVKIEFTNIFREKSVIYLKNIPHRWQDYKIRLSDFKGISNWSEITNLSFIVEEWNVKEKHGVVYIDNIRLLR